MNRAKPLRLVVLGANGRTGILVVGAALERGMEVTAVVRSADKRPDIRHDRLMAAVGDPCDKDFLREVLKGQDAVISTLGGKRPTKAATAVSYRSAAALVEAARQTSVNRVLVTSTALLFPEQTPLGHVLRLVVPNTVRSATSMENILKVSGLIWTSARPGFLVDRDDAAYRVHPSKLPAGAMSVSRRALAAFLLDAIDDPQAHCAALGLSNTPMAKASLPAETPAASAP
ncbi:MAG: NAD(P)-binding oxidoreductase [Pseudomonadota bacterium]